MRFAAGLSAILLFGSLGLADDNRLTSDEKSAGWVLLFDGKSTEGWLEVTGSPFPSTSWKVENGCVCSFANPNGIQDIRTKNAFLSFEFSFDWTIETAGNSGVKYWIEKVDRWASKSGNGYQARARGAEYQLADDEHTAVALANPKQATGALYSKLAPSRRTSLPVGKFNHSVIVVKGGHAEHWLNGFKVVEYDGMPLQSPIALQNHSSATCFKNLKVRVLRTESAPRSAESGNN